MFFQYLALFIFFIVFHDGFTEKLRIKELRVPLYYKYHTICPLTFITNAYVTTKSFKLKYPNVGYLISSSYYSV